MKILLLINELIGYLQKIFIPEFNHVMLKWHVEIVARKTM